MGGCSATGGSTFNFTLYIILAQSLVCGAPSAAALQAVRDAQQTNGGWNFIGDPTTSDIDPDTTALAIQALVASGADATDPTVRARRSASSPPTSRRSGAWQSFGVDDPNSTSLSILGITAAGLRRRVVLLARHRRPVAGRHSVHEPDCMAALAAAHQRRRPTRAAS